MLGPGGCHGFGLLGTIMTTSRPNITRNHYAIIIYLLSVLAFSLFVGFKRGCLFIETSYMCQVLSTTKDIKKLTICQVLFVPVDWQSKLVCIFANYMKAVVYFH